jgi:hypothetical protein
MSGILADVFGILPATIALLPIGFRNLDATIEELALVEKLVVERLNVGGALHRDRQRTIRSLANDLALRDD